MGPRSVSPSPCPTLPSSHGRRPVDSVTGSRGPMLRNASHRTVTATIVCDVVQPHSCFRIVLMLRCLSVSLLGLWSFATAASAHEGADHSHPADGSHAPARGIVFEDTNRNGTRDPGEKGIAGVGVSNGAAI